MNVLAESVSLCFVENMIGIETSESSSRLPSERVSPITKCFDRARRELSELIEGQSFEGAYKSHVKTASFLLIFLVWALK